MLLCQLYGVLKSSTIVRGDCTGTGNFPEKKSSPVAPEVGLEMKFARPSLGKLAVSRLL